MIARVAEQIAIALIVASQWPGIMNGLLNITHRENRLKRNSNPPQKQRATERAFGG
jgi:hypothetical protein